MNKKRKNRNLGKDYGSYYAKENSNQSENQPMEADLI